jgi:RimJ/RimL family protein N-acetyltransferase
MAIEGIGVRLREERASDIDFVAALRNDIDTQARPKTLPPHYTREMMTKRYEAREFSFDPDDGRFIIEAKDASEPVGFIGYSSLKRRFSANLGVMVAKQYWGTGHAREANELLLRFMFEELGLRVVRLWTHSMNPRAIALAAKLGFREAARFRRAVYRNGHLGESVVMDMTRQEFYELREDLTDRLPDPYVQQTADSNRH